VCAIQNLWLAARAESIAVGWVSILDPLAMKKLLRIPPGVPLVAYLCIGYVEEFAPSPDLERIGWEERTSLRSVLREEFFDQPTKMGEKAQ
jgi:5,6-dimethylbenzimidazole synthase